MDVETQTKLFFLGNGNKQTEGIQGKQKTYFLTDGLKTNKFALLSFKRGVYFVNIIIHSIDKNKVISDKIKGKK